MGLILILYKSGTIDKKRSVPHNMQILEHDDDFPENLCECFHDCGSFVHSFCIWPFCCLPCRIADNLITVPKNTTFGLIIPIARLFFPALIRLLVAIFSPQGNFLNKSELLIIPFSRSCVLPSVHSFFY